MSTVRELRENVGMSQRELGIRIGLALRSPPLTQQEIAKIEASEYDAPTRVQSAYLFAARSSLSDGYVMPAGIISASVAIDVDSTALWMSEGAGSDIRAWGQGLMAATVGDCLIAGYSKAHHASRLCEPSFSPPPSIAHFGSKRALITLAEARKTMPIRHRGVEI